MVDVVLPVLNEAGSIPWVLERMPPGFRPLVVDNNSTDGSGELAEGLGATVIVERQPGFGAACWAGLISAESDVLCFMDCDGSLDPQDLPKVCDPVAAGGSDLVLGSRKDSAAARPLHSRVANRVLAWEIGRRTGVRMDDLGPMRAARREGLLALGLRDRRFGWPLEMVLKAAAAGWRIEQVPIPYHPRIAGESKVTGTLLGTLRTIKDMGALLK